VLGATLHGAANVAVARRSHILRGE
jgi:hypothetical protein